VLFCPFQIKLAWLN